MLLAQLEGILSFTSVFVEFIFIDGTITLLNFTAEHYLHHEKHSTLGIGRQ